tara:strand:+ start:245 stop:523 length:279 start_codon:yes stop_codon:yes gene_type:complete
MVKDQEIRVFMIYGDAKKRLRIIQSMKNLNGVGLISPESFRSDYKSIQKECKIQVLVIDEGHKAKNLKTKLRVALKEFKVERQKILLSGTPI